MALSQQRDAVKPCTSLEMDAHDASGGRIILVTSKTLILLLLLLLGETFH